MKLNKKLLAVALAIVFATVSLVAADEAGIVTFNILNSSNSQVNLNISNSTVQGQTNYTDSQATENITLTNSTLTLNVNGQNKTISSQGDNLVVSTQNQSVTVNSYPRPLLTVAFLGSQPATHSIISTNGTIEYDFNITVSVPTSMNYPFGVNATSPQISQALLPLVDKYNLVANNFNGRGNITSAQWVDKPIVDGMNTFGLFSYEQLNATQVESLTNDLFNAFAAAMNGTA